MSEEISKKNIFISYSHEDEEWKKRLVTHLGVLQKQGLLEVWDDKQIGAGDDWLGRIKGILDSVSMAILLISASILMMRETGLIVLTMTIQYDIFGHKD